MKKFGYLSRFTVNGDLLGAEAAFEAKGIPVDGGDLSKVDFLLLFGGEDISPYYYGEKPVGTGAPKEPSFRDRIEETFFRAAVENEVPVLGICRGAQFACCLLGGKLWQDVDMHDYQYHSLIVDGKTYQTNSYHHQMMRPTEEMEILGYTPCRSPVKMAERPTKDEGDEPEIVLHRAKKVLMVQGHPEWVGPKDDLVVITNKLMSEHLL